MPAVFDSLTDCFEAFARVGHRNNEVETLAVRRIGMQHQRRVAHDLFWVRLDKREANHARHENGAVSAFGIAVHVAKIASHARGDIDQTRGERAINISAELRTDREPKFVVARVAAVWRFEVAFEV